MSQESEGTSLPPGPGISSLSLGRKKRIRGGYRAHSTKLCGEAKIILETDEPSLVKIEHLSISLKEKLSLLHAIDDEIFNLITDEEVEIEVIECEDLRSDIQCLIVELDTKKDEIKSKIQSENNSDISAPTTVRVTRPYDDSAKLPKLQLPKYNGDPRKWQEWWDSYETVHDNSNIAPVMKFRHLKSLLEGNAAIALTGIQLTSANYEEAIDILKNRFAQKQVIINAHMEALLNLQSASTEKDIKTLRKLFDSIEINVRSLKCLGIDFEQYGALLIPIIMSKVPEEIRLIITKGIKGEDWGLDGVVEIFRTELEAREKCGQLQLKNPGNSHPSHRQIQAQNSYTTSALFNNNETRITCSFCKNSHPSVKCPNVTDPKERKNILKRQGRCFVCLKKGHLSRDCKSNIQCFVCKQRHHASVCESRGQSAPIVFSHPTQQYQSSPNLPVNASISIPERNLRDVRPRTISQQMPHSPQPQSSSATTTMFINSKNSVLLQTAKGYISAANNCEKTAIARLIFDSGSHRSYISKRLRDILALPTVAQETQTINTFGQSNGVKQTCDVTQFCVRSQYSDLSIYIEAYVVPVVCAPLNSQEIQLAASQYPHIAALPLADFHSGESAEVDILIGLDYYWEFLSGGCMRGELGGPVALESKLGWILSGQLPNCPVSKSTATNLTQTHVLKISDVNEDDNLESQLSRFWSLEELGINVQKENSVYKRFEEEIKLIDGRYEVKLPWKAEHPILPDNFSLSRRRLQKLIPKLKANPVLLEEYDSIIRDQEKRCIIERVSANEENPVGKTHYLAHHPVIRQDKDTTKVRIVYDASASTSSGTSLNNCVYPGPCLLKTVVEVLARFRLNPIALISDIEKAFLMISINKSDRDALRFLWYTDVKQEQPEMVTYRFCRVVFGVSCSPFLLNATLKHHVTKYSTEHPEICKKLINSFYADDCNSGSHSVAETMKLYDVSRKIMQEGGFNLRKWRSNSAEVMELIETKEIPGSPKPKNCKPLTSLTEEDQSYAKTTTGKLDLNESIEGKVLGVPWNSNTDSLVFKLSHLTKITAETPVTKRKILKTIASLFDPLGLISPITAPLKVLLQKLFEQKIGWDAAVPDTIEKEWREMMKELEQANEISVSRYYFNELKAKPEKIQLFGFCDSSEHAYAALVYAKVIINGKASVSLVMSKTRVAPLSKLTIPRLELMSCLILARLITSVRDILSPLASVEIVKCWTDSISALYWITGINKEWKIFVENRVQEVRKLVGSDLWSHCPGKENPADLPTRKSRPTLLEDRSEWWNGPPWLSNDEESWPNRSTSEELPDDCLGELRRPVSSETTVLLTEVNPDANFEEAFNISRFSSYKKLVRVAAYALRFIQICKKKSDQKGELSTSEINQAEQSLIRHTQSYFPQEQLDKARKQLGLFKDADGIIRCKGRLNNSDLHLETRNPILLPRSHHVTALLIRQSHADVMHNGVKETLLQVRSRFWIVKGRQLVKKILHSCATCRRIQGQSYGEPETGQMPEFRVTGGHAFESVGIDFAGPLYVKTRSNSLEKVYLAIFTCGATRALHLELVPDLSTDTFLLCLKRFVSRQGTPNLIVTDNAKTFKAASKNLVNLFKSPNVNSYLSGRRIKWKYNLAKAPWWGGFYERLIKSVKLCLKKNLGTVKLTYDELHTVITQIEAVLNSRPLTYLYSDGLEEPLTPAHLVKGRRLLGLPERIEDKDEDFNETAHTARKREQYLSRVLQHYWRRWKEEYLVDLREYHKIQHKRNNVPGIKQGDVVTIEDENRRNRTSWQLARVESVLKGQDNVARGARVRLANGNVIERPLQKLYPLEISNNEIISETESDQEDESAGISTRPRRKAATIAAERIQIIDHLENNEI